MPAPYITLTANVAFQEVSKDGWGFCRMASAFEIEQRGLERLWREPSEGAIRLLPSCFNHNGVLNPDFASSILRLTDFHKSDDIWKEARAYRVYGPPTATEQPVYQFLLGHPDAAHEIDPISVGVDLSSLLTSFDDLEGLAWALQTVDLLSPNEGIAFHVWPASVVSTGNTYDVACAFGGWYALALSVSGQVDLFKNQGTYLAPEWALVKSKAFSQSGNAQSAGVQVAIIPHGANKIGIYLSSAQQTDTKMLNIGSPDDRYLIYEVPNVVRDEGTGLYKKTEAGSLSFAFQKSGQNYQFIPSLIRYQSNTFKLATEYMDQARPYSTIQLFSVGISQEKATLAITPSNVDVSYTNHEGAVFDVDVDRAFIPAFLLEPSSDSKYSPEVWALDGNIATGVYTPTTTERDWSARWSSISGELSRTNEPKYFNASLVHPTSEHDLLLKLPPTYRLEIDGVVLSEGYLNPVSRVLRGSRGLIFESVEGVDILWARLSETSLAHFRALNVSRSLGSSVPSYFDILEEVANRCGMAAEIRAGSEFLADYEMGSILTPNDFKVIAEDVSSDDFIRGFDGAYGVQGRSELVTVWNPATSAVSFGFDEEYAADPDNPTEEELPDIFFMLDDDFVEAFTGTVQTDTDRWNGVEGKRFFGIKDQPEFHISAPEHNGVRCFASTGSGRADGLSVSVAPDPAALTDEEHANFSYGLKYRDYGPNETAAATDAVQLEIFARKRHDEECKAERYLAVEGEWQPYLNPETLARPFVCVVGKNPDGDWVSYGAWRMTNVHYEIECDDDPAETITGFGGAVDRRFTWSGSYFLEYVGIAEYELAPVGEEDPVELLMFSDVLP